MTPDKPKYEGLLALFLFITGIIGGTPDKRIYEGLISLINGYMRVYFALCFFFCWFWVFIGMIGGTPDKRIYEDLL